MSLIELSHPRRDLVNPRPASPLLRLRVLVRRGRLDRLLAEGTSPNTDPRLTLRATQLARPALRAALAHSLLNALRSIDSPISRFPSPHIPVAAASVRACSPELCNLARALTDIDARARGVAITRVLLTDGGSPLYMNGPADRLRKVLLAARAALYDAPTPEAIRKTAARNQLPVERITQVRVLDPYSYSNDSH
jgi:hypothetical protein